MENQAVESESKTSVELEQNEESKAKIDQNTSKVAEDPSKIPIFTNPKYLYYSVAFGIVSLSATLAICSYVFLKTDQAKSSALGGALALTGLTSQFIVKSAATQLQNKKVDDDAKENNYKRMLIEKEVQKQFIPFQETQNKILDLCQEIVGVRQEIVSLENKVDARFNQIETRFNQIETRFNQVDARFNQVDAKLVDMQNQINSGFSENHNDIRLVHQRIDNLEQNGFEVKKNQD
jgi:hypothetical protein